MSAIKSVVTSVGEVGSKSVGRELSKDAFEMSAKDAMKQAGKQTSSEVTKKAAAMAAVGAIGYFAFDALDEYNKKNNRQFQITAIKNWSGLFSSGRVMIEFTPGEDITLTDTISLSGTDCSPPLNGEYNIVEILAPSQIVISATISHDGTAGTMTLHTTYESQLSRTVEKSAQFVGGTVGGVTSGVISGATSGAISGLGVNVGFQAISATLAVVIIVILLSLVVLSLR